MAKNGEGVIVGEVELLASEDNVKMNFMLSQSAVVVTFDRKDTAKLVKELSEWLSLPPEMKIERTS